jgi:ornithine cyclodeaminase/alanine dehydrogenase-like protein (mu-crystallin family)
MLFLQESDVLALLPIGTAIGLLRDAFIAYSADRAQNQPRRRLFMNTGAVLHAMAGAHGKYFGTKVYSTHPVHGAWFLVLLYDAATAKPLAMIEADRLGQIRTGAASGLATDLLAAPDAATLGVIGSGFQAETQVQAVRAVRRIKEVRVYSRSVERRASFAARMDAVVSPTARDAVEGVHIVVTATTAKNPVIERVWIAPGTHINAVGSNHAQRRELPADLLEAAGVIVADSIEQCRLEAGDLLLGLPAERWETLSELRDVAERPPSWRRDGISIFKSVGLGLEDVAVAAFVYERAQAEGIGVKIRVT